MKRLVAYSSVSHMGFVALGIAAWSPVALSGAVLQMVNHGVTTGALFAIVGMLDERTDSREIATYGGIWGKVPMLSFFFLLFCMASAGVPGLNNFVGEFLVLVGTFRVSPAAAAGAFLGIVLTLIYTVRLVQEILFGKENKPLALSDLSLREGAMLAVLAVVAVYLGVHPGPVLELIKAPDCPADVGQVIPLRPLRNSVVMLLPEPILMTFSDIFSLMPIIITGCAALLVLLCGPVPLAGAFISWIAIARLGRRGRSGRPFLSAPVALDSPRLRFQPAGAVPDPGFLPRRRAYASLLPRLQRAPRHRGGGIPCHRPLRPLRHVHPPLRTNLLILFLALEAISFAFYILVSIDLGPGRVRRGGAEVPADGSGGHRHHRLRLIADLRRQRHPRPFAALGRCGNRAIISAGWGVVADRHRLQTLPGPRPPLDTRRLPGRPGTGRGFPLHRLEGGGRCLSPHAARLLARRSPRLHAPLYALSLLSMVIGNLAALLQKNIKRMLAYSSIAHMGYLALALLTGTKDGYAAVLLYGAIYTAMNLAAFGAIASLSGAAGTLADRRLRRRRLQRSLPRRRAGPRHAGPGRHPADRRLHRQVLHLLRRHPAAARPPLPSSAS